MYKYAPLSQKCIFTSKLRILYARFYAMSENSTPWQLPINCIRLHDDTCNCIPITLVTNIPTNKQSFTTENNTSPGVSAQQYTLSRHFFQIRPDDRMSQLNVRYKAIKRQLCIFNNLSLCFVISVPSAISSWMSVGRRLMFPRTHTRTPFLSRKSLPHHSPGLRQQY